MVDMSRGAAYISLVLVVLAWVASYLSNYDWVNLATYMVGALILIVTTIYRNYIY